MFIEIGIVQFAYAKRTWWTLSSLVEQERPPSFSVRLNVHVDDPFWSLNDKLIRTFNHLLNLNVVVWRNRDFFRRGYARNADVMTSAADWLALIDADTVFDPKFLSQLSQRSLNNNRVTGVPRITMTDFDAGYRLIDAEQYDDQPVHNAALKCAGVSCLRRNRRAGAGYFHLVHPATIRDRGLIYADGRKDRALDDAHGPTTPSDRRLRNEIGLDGLSDLPPIYHLQHWRRSQAECPEGIKSICH